MAQRKRAGLITRKSLDRNEVLLLLFFFFLALNHFFSLVYSEEALSNDNSAPFANIIVKMIPTLSWCCLLATLLIFAPGENGFGYSR